MRVSGSADSRGGEGTRGGDAKSGAPAGAGGGVGGSAFGKRGHKNAIQLELSDGGVVSTGAYGFTTKQLAASLAASKPDLVASEVAARKQSGVGGRGTSTTAECVAKG